jgi:hypothetical protein
VALLFVALLFCEHASCAHIIGAQGTCNKSTHCAAVMAHMRCSGHGAHALQRSWRTCIAAGMAHMRLQSPSWAMVEKLRKACGTVANGGVA